jgi:hypothetical protein
MALWSEVPAQLAVSEAACPRSPFTIRRGSTGADDAQHSAGGTGCLRPSAAPAVPLPAGGCPPPGSGGGHQASSGTAVCLPWPSGTRSWATRARCRPPRRYGGRREDRVRPCRWVGLPRRIPFRARPRMPFRGRSGPGVRPATKEEGDSHGAGGRPAACRTNTMIMQTDPTARHSAIGSFRCRCYVVVLWRQRPSCCSTQRTVPGGTTAAPPAMSSAATQHRVTPLAVGSDQVTCVCSCRRSWVRWWSLPTRRPGARVAPGCLPGYVRVGRSVSARLTAKLTAKLHDNRGPGWIVLDGYIRPELRGCGRQCPADQLTRAAVDRMSAAIVSAGTASSGTETGVSRRPRSDR